MKKYFTFILISFLFFCSSVNASKAPVDITKMSIEELQEALSKRIISSELLVNLYIERINEYDGQFNSIREINPEAINEAKKLDEERKSGNVRGPLHGIPILVKTNIDVKGMATTAGTKTLSDNYPIENSFVVQKLIDAGAIILGSTNMSELAFSASNSYSSYGYVRNVFNTEMTSYGSSGGSAVAVGAAFAAASLGTDTNSSVRVPASGAGIVGIRPTLGLVSRDGVIPYDVERDTVGVMSRTVKDNALILSVISGEDESDKYTKGSIGYDYSSLYNDDNLEGVTIGVIVPFAKGVENGIPPNSLTDPGIYSLVEASIKKLKDTGANIVYIDEFLTYSNYLIANNTQAGITMCDGFNEYIKGTNGTIRSFEQLAASSGHVQNLSGYVSGCNGGYASKDKRDAKKAIFREDVDEIFELNNLDVILYPSVKNLVFGYKSSKVISPGSSLGSVIGYPSITVPMGFYEGQAYGIEFLSKAYEEDKIYDVALAFEKVNDNKISNSKLTPSLYSVPESVTKLVDIYLNVEFNNAVMLEYESELIEYFENYSSNDNALEDAEALLTRYDELVMKNNNIKIIIIVVSILVLLYFLFKNGKNNRKKRRNKKVTRL